MTITEIAWLAGLLEGEGTFFQPRRHGTLRVVLGMTDKDIVERAAALVGNPFVYLAKRKNKPVNHKDQFWWMLTGHRAAGLMMTIYSFMGLRRRAKIKELLVNWRQRKYKRNTRGREITECVHRARRHYAKGLCKPCYDTTRTGRRSLVDRQCTTEGQFLLGSDSRQGDGARL